MSTVSMMSLTPIGSPARRPGRPARSASRACASACSGSSQVQALTDLRSSARSRQARISASAVSAPEPSRVIASAAESWLGAVIAVLPGGARPRGRYRAAAHRHAGGRPAGCRPAARPAPRRPATSGTACRARVHNPLNTAEPVEPRPFGAWPGAGRVRIASNPPAQSARRGAGLVGAPPGGAEIVEAQFAAGGNAAVGQESSLSSAACRCSSGAWLRGAS